MVIGAVEGQSEVDVAKQAGTLVRAYHYLLRYAGQRTPYYLQISICVQLAMY